MVCLGFEPVGPHDNIKAQIEDVSPSQISWGFEPGAAEFEGAANSSCTRTLII